MNSSQSLVTLGIAEEDSVSMLNRVKKVRFFEQTAC